MDVHSNLQEKPIDVENANSISVSAFGIPFKTQKLGVSAFERRVKRGSTQFSTTMERPDHHLRRYAAVEYLLLNGCRKDPGSKRVAMLGFRRVTPRDMAENMLKKTQAQGNFDTSCQAPQPTLFGYY